MKRIISRWQTIEMTNLLKQQMDENSIRTWTDRIYCLIFGVCVIYDFISISTLSDLFPKAPYETVMSVLSRVETIAAIYCMALILLNAWKYRNEIRKALPSLILFIFIAIYLCNNNDDIDLVVLLLFAASSDGVSLKKIYRTYLLTSTVTLTVLFVFSMTGLIGNLGGNSFGLSYRTDYAAYLLAIMMVLALYYEDSTMPESLQLLYPLMTWYMNQIIAAKTATICMLLLWFGVYWREYRRENALQKKGWRKILFAALYLLPAVLRLLHDRLVRHVHGQKLHNRLRAFCSWFFTYSFVIYAALMIILTAVYYKFPADLVSRLYYTVLSTFVVRLLLGNVAFQSYPLTLFGNDIPQRGVGWHQGSYIHFYYILDSSYVRLLMLYGAYVLILVLGVATAVQLRLRREKKFTSLFILSLMALDCTMEHHITQFIYAAPFLMLFARWDLPMREGSSWHFDHVKTGLFIWRFASIFGVTIFLLPLFSGIIDRIYLWGAGICTFCFLLSLPGKHLFQRRWVRIIAEMMGLAIFATALYSCWYVTTASSSVPVYDATLVIPGSQMEGENNTDLLTARVKAGEEYLAEYRDINCVVSGPEAEQMKQMLLCDGIEEDRIYLDSVSTSIAETLSESDSIIKENDLSPRKVLSVLDLQQARTGLIAEAQYDNIRMISAHCPRLQYFAVLLTEQVRYTWERLSGN